MYARQLSNRSIFHASLVVMAVIHMASIPKAIASYRWLRPGRPIRPIIEWNTNPVTKGIYLAKR